MERDSPIHTVGLLKHTRRRILDSSSGEELEYCRAADTHTRSPDLVDLTSCSGPTLSDSCRASTSRGSSTEQMEVNQGMVIELDQETDGSWHSEDEEQGYNTDTSTPAYKRGRHEQSGQPSPTGPRSDLPSPYRQSRSLSRQLKPEKVRQAIIQEGLEYTLPTWATQKRDPSVLILSDARMEDWPWSDGICLLEFHQNRQIRNWAQSIRDGEINTKCNTVILYLEGLKTWNDVPPMKNVIHGICAALRQKNPGSRIFVSNLVPIIRTSPIGLTVQNLNFLVTQATRSVNRAMGKVHVLSAYEHFFSTGDQQIIQPIHQYFKQNEHLTRLGCITLRDIFLREAGLKPYWFDDESRSRRN